MAFNNYARIRARQEKEKMRILKCNPTIDNGTGIYIFYRYDPTVSKGVCYIGQAKHLLDRLASHLMGYQAIDLSIKKHGLYDCVKNPEGYRVAVVCHCDIYSLDKCERQAIESYQKDGWMLKNITAGGQIDKGGDINQRKASKGYLDGLKQGYSNCLKDIKEFFDKYLDFVIKEPRLTKKGTPVAIKQTKFKEFEKLLKGGQDEVERHDNQ